MNGKTWKKIIPPAVFLAITALLIILPMNVRNKGEKAAYEYISAQAELRNISSSLSGGGAVKAQDKEDVTLPEGVEITRFLVSNGESVEAGQPVAEVDSLTVLAAIARVRESMDELEKKISSLTASGSDATVKCVADGRVKAVFAEKGDDVRSVIIEYGSLGIVSLDGLMSAEIACDSDLLTGDPVKVKCPDGTEYPGKVSSSLDGALTVTVTDNGPEIGDVVEVYDSEGILLGLGVLEVNSPWNVICTDGTVDKVNMKPGGTVKKGSILVCIKDTGLTERENYSRKHREYEELMQDLLKMLQSGQITAPCDGFVSGVDKTKATGLTAGIGHGLTLLAYHADDEETDEAVIQIYTLVLVTSVNGNNYMGKTYTVPASLLGGIDPATPEGKQAILALAPSLMEFASEMPLNISGTVAGKPIEAGDLFLIGPSSGSYIGQVTMPEKPDISGIGGFGASAEEPEMFPLDENVILSVTPTEEMSITISVDELDILRYSPGMPADIYIDALPGESFTGTVKRIAAVGTNSGGSSKYDVTVVLPYSERIIPGMNASVVIHTGSTGIVITVPAAALHDSGSKCIVYTGFDEKKGEVIDTVTVEVGASDGEFVEIISGLAEGHTVWYADYSH